MSADRILLLQIAVACGLIGHADLLHADDEDLPDTEFLEYLGSWEESDEDWLILNDADSIRAQQTNEDRSDPVPMGEESTESDDER